jgi:hypothetical protein
VTFKGAENAVQDAYAATGGGSVISVVISSNRIFFIRARIAEVMMYYGIGGRITSKTNGSGYD